MLCSGDELGLSSDADGILILPSDTPLGLPLEDLVGEIVLDVDVKPNRGDALSIIGLAREVAAATGATLRWPDIHGRRVGRCDRGPPLGGRPGHCSLSAVRGRYLDGVTHRAVAVRHRPATARRRRAAHQQRRGCQQLRDARAGQAHPHLRRRRHHGRPDRGPWRSPGGASRRPWITWTGARPRRAAHRRPGRAAGHRRRHGRPDQRGLRDHDPGRGGVGHLRPGEHPPHRHSGTRSGARRASASRRARSTGWRASAPTAPRS